MPKQRLTPSVVASLDAARAISAIYVVLYHLREHLKTLERLGFILRFGQEAVMVFFLLSGFVIFANEKHRALSPRGYFLRRLRRIYPPLLVAMAISTLIALSNHSLSLDFNLRSLWGTLLSLQDISSLKPGVITNPYLGNDPLWSLSYEVAFYILFPIVLWFWTRHPKPTNHAVGLISCLFYLEYVWHPNHFLLVGAYFSLWWAGAMACEAYFRGGRNVGAMLPTLLWVSALAAIAIAVALRMGSRSIGYYPLLPARHFVVCVLLLGILFSPLGQALSKLALKSKTPATLVATVSYGIYVLHYPLLVQWHWAHSTYGFMVACILLVMVSYLAERQLPRILPQAPKE